MAMKTMYDVQQLLKRFGIFIYTGKRKFDLELMAIEVEELYAQNLLEKEEYLLAQLILKRELQNE